LEGKWKGIHGEKREGDNSTNGIKEWKKEGES
jgi:hypothetical protein